MPSTKRSAESMRPLEPHAALIARVLAGKAFTIKTPPCVELAAKLREWLITGALGAIVYGRPRLGKTMGARWVLSSLGAIFGQRIPWAEIPVREALTLSEGGFFQYLLRCLRTPYAARGTVTDRRDRLAEALRMRARRSSIRTVILFFDEAQLLTKQHFNWLLNISNELDKDGYRTFFLLVGQPELRRKKDEFIAASEPLLQIVGRFMSQEWPYSGVKTVAQLRSCLSEMDVACYPQVDGLPFPAHFLPQAVETNWKLADGDQYFWDAFDATWRGVLREIALDEEEEVMIPMHYLSASIAAYLNSLTRRDIPELRHDPAMIEAAVLKSGFRDAVLAYAPARR